MVLSIAPPGEAEAIARTIGGCGRRASSRPLVADLNAVSPETARRIEAALAAGGLDLVDGSISGPAAARRRDDAHLPLRPARAARSRRCPSPAST